MTSTIRSPIRRTCRIIIVCRPLALGVAWLGRTNARKVQIPCPASNFPPFRRSSVQVSCYLVGLCKAKAYFHLVCSHLFTCIALSAFVPVFSNRLAVLVIPTYRLLAVLKRKGRPKLCDTCVISPPLGGPSHHAPCTQDTKGKRSKSQEKKEAYNHSPDRDPRFSGAENLTKKTKERARELTRFHTDQCTSTRKRTAARRREPQPSCQPDPCL